MRGLFFCAFWKVVPKEHGQGCSSALILRDVPSIYLEGQVSLLKSNPKRDGPASKTKKISSVTLITTGMNYSLLGIDILSRQGSQCSNFSPSLKIEP